MWYKRKGLLAALLALVVVVDMVVMYRRFGHAKDDDFSVYEPPVEGPLPSSNAWHPVNDGADKLALARGDLADSAAITKLFGLFERPNLKQARHTYSTIYDDIFADNGVDSVIGTLSMAQRCDIYFTRLFQRNINWLVDPHEDLSGEWRDQRTFEDFAGHKKNKEKYVNDKHLEVSADDIWASDPDYQEFIKPVFEEAMAKVNRHEQRFHDVASHVRIFNKCYVTNDDEYQVKQDKSMVDTQKRVLHDVAIFKPGQTTVEIPDKVSQVEKKVYPWLSFDYPVFEDHRGMQKFVPPDYRKVLKGKEYDVVFQPSSSQGRKITKPAPSALGSDGHPSWLNQFKNRLQGKGIVMSIADKHVNDAVKFIRLLRALDNVYPLQIVYYDDLSPESKQRLVHAAREKMIVPPKSFHDVNPDYFKPGYMDHTNERGEMVGLRPQTIHFVNVFPAISKEYRNKFGGFGNKFFATFFNSFEEFIIVDADTVLLHPPQYFFSMDKYVEKGAYFWKDRLMTMRRPKSDGFFFDKVSPSVVDQVMFGIPIITNFTLDNGYFNKLQYLQESGVVTVDRKRHFGSLLMCIMLQFYGLSRDRSYGDKELFWAGFSVNGDEDYAWSDHFAGSIGPLTPKHWSLKHGKTDGDNPENWRKAREVCSPHPAHVSGQDNTIAWFNSGFQTCGKTEQIGDKGVKKDFEQHRQFRWLETLDEFRAFYDSPLDIEACIVPPETSYDTMERKNDEGEPGVGWHWAKEYCKQYTYCAYDRIGGKRRTQDGEEEDTHADGVLVTPGVETRHYYRYLGDVWIASE
ncbi:hypothetical protein DIURU_001130 [Diutina rugosa]|uniref:Alpha-1,3-mannosyltransferase n=1 Tax=Diutina rugosa TaxID=5481 RepID=A0A642UVC1_DIURU|nr:uncharacterized protein DIURU_001130 [Diutina rugosa]KAA8906188.1 hypothetical protein DIURU_001130 [Diutina rugosa]